MVARLKQITPSAIGIHCAAHGLNIVASHIPESVPYIKKSQNPLRQLFDYFDNSAV